MKPKKPAPELDSTKVLHLTVAGVRVRLRVDSGGWPLSAGAGLPDSTHEGLVSLAAQHVLELARQQAQRGRSADAAVESARKRTQASVEHWANAYLARAHREHPEFGRARLAQHARRLAMQDGIEPDTKRDEISVDRAQQFLDRLRNGPRR